MRRGGHDRRGQAAGRRWLTSLRGYWSGYLACRKGVAALEFALLLPIMLLVALGGFAVTQAVATYRKLTDTTVETANVAAQYTSMYASDAQAVMGATSQIMAPYPTTSLKMVMSLITTSSSNVATVAWSQPYQGATPLIKLGAFTMPPGMTQPSTSYVLIQTSYSFVPIAGNQYFPSFPMQNHIFILPRQSPSIPCTMPGSPQCP